MECITRPKHTSTSVPHYLPPVTRFSMKVRHTGMRVTWKPGCINELIVSHLHFRFVDKSNIKYNPHYSGVAT